MSGLLCKQQPGFCDVGRIVACEPPYVVQVPALKALQDASIGCMIYYPIPCHRLPVYADRGIEMPVADSLADEVLSLPIWATIEPEVQQRIRDVIAEVVS